jgi:DNA invertase Pin-like site-specific DNA recombinase
MHQARRAAMNSTRAQSKSGLTALDELRAEKVHAWHRERLAVVYVRQSTPQQVLDHQESTRLQYGLVSRAQALGWALDRILVIDEDLGKSGTSAQRRFGFQRLVSEVSLDHVGVIFGIEMSRLARSNRDWHQLLELCALFHTLIADLDGMYDPAQYNDRLLLGLKGTMSEAELHILKQRMHQGRLSKAQRGDLQFALPVGYVWSPTGEIQFDPDEQVRTLSSDSSSAPSRSWAPLAGWSARLSQHQIQLGVRVREGQGYGELVWRRPNRATLQMMLKHPLYAGSYVYGRAPWKIRVANTRSDRAQVVWSWARTSGWSCCPTTARPTFLQSSMNATSSDCKPTELALMPWEQRATAQLS